MRKLITFICIMLFAMFSINTTSYAASVDPEFHEGNDSNPNDYQPPEGCVHFEIPNSGTPGTYTVTFDATGAYDPMGPFSFTVVVGTAPGEDFTKVLSWSSNFPIDAVIVKGGNGFNLYPYGTNVRSDTNLVSPNNASGHPADVSHVSIVICPEDFPPEPPTPTPSPTPTPTSTPTPTPTATPTPTVTPTPTPCPPCPPCPPTFFCCIGIFIIFVVLIVVAFLLGFLWGGFDPCCRKHRHHKKHPCNDCDDCDDHDDTCGHKERKNGPTIPTRKDFF